MDPNNVGPVGMAPPPPPPPPGPIRFAEDDPLIPHLLRAPVDVIARICRMGHRGRANRWHSATKEMRTISTATRDAVDSRLWDILAPTWTNIIAFDSDHLADGIMGRDNPTLPVLGKKLVERAPRVVRALLTTGVDRGVLSGTQTKKLVRAVAMHGSDRTVRATLRVPMAVGLAPQFGLRYTVPIARSRQLLALDWPMPDHALLDVITMLGMSVQDANARRAMLHDLLRSGKCDPSAAVGAHAKTPLFAWCDWHVRQHGHARVGDLVALMRAGAGKTINARCKVLPVGRMETVLEHVVRAAVTTRHTMRDCEPILQLLLAHGADVDAVPEHLWHDNRELRKMMQPFSFK